ncbi:MAG: TIGR02300 family protein [bacterium]|nr:TIGR02300 family protein [bacterium]
MSSKAARGTKRLCEGCGAKFYDLNNTPIICPMCEVEFKLAKPTEDKDAKAKAKEAEAAAKEAADAKKKKAADAEIDPDVAAINDDDLADIEDSDDDDSDDSTDAFLPDEDEGGDDVSEIVGDNKPKVEDEG